jgi:hypothetical protein
MSEAPGTADIVLVDTNVFVAVGGPDHDKYQALRSVVQREGVVLQIPERVEAELRTMQMTNRVETAVDDGWAELVSPPEPTDGDAVTAMDFTRRDIANQTDTHEHEVEKADTVFAGLAIQYLKDDTGGSFVVLTDDKVAATAIQRAVEQQGYGTSISVLRLSDVIEDEIDDDFRVI